MRKRIVISEDMPPGGMAILRQRADIMVEVLADPTQAALAAALPRAEAVILVAEQPRLTSELIAAAPHLVLAARMGAGTDNFDLPALTARRIPLLTTGATNAAAVAEHAMYLMLALAKRGPSRDRAIKGGGWPRGFGAIELAGQTCLVVGVGRIGREVVRRARAFDMRVIGFDPALTPESVRDLGIAIAPTLQAGLAQADVVVLACALTETTRNLIDARAFFAMKPTALLVNVARGGVIDEQALAAALAEGRIGGAGLDVMATEPPARDSALLARDDVVLTPHTASHVSSVYERMSVICARMIIDGLDGRLDPACVVNRDVLV